MWITFVGIELQGFLLKLGVMLRKFLNSSKSDSSFLYHDLFFSLEVLSDFLLSGLKIWAYVAILNE